MESGNYLVLEIKDAYRTEKLRYYFTNKLPQIPEQNYDSSDKLYYNYIGVEILPFEGKGELIIQNKIGEDIFDERGAFIGRKVYRDIKNTIPKEVLEKLKEYRKTRLTIDLDNNYFKPEILNEIYKISKNPIFKKTQRGYHVIINLQKPLNFEERIKLREKLGDDIWRIKYDKTLVELGFEGLTDILFDYKWWEGEKQFYQWEITNKVNVEAEMSFELPEMKINFEDKEVEIKSKYVYLKNFPPNQVYWTVKSIEDNFWIYAHAVKQKQNFLNLFYSVVRKHCGTILATKLKLYEEQGLVQFIQSAEGPIIVELKGDAQELAGLLIGKQGIKIKIIQAELGMQIKIKTERQPVQYTPIEEAIKQRLGDALSKFTDVRVQKIRKYL
jgi:predicted DNA-binding protein YlxM (UPF0122 family)